MNSIIFITLLVLLILIGIIDSNNTSDQQTIDDIKIDNNMAADDRTAVVESDTIDVSEQRQKKKTNAIIEQGKAEEETKSVNKRKFTTTQYNHTPYTPTPHKRKHISPVDESHAANDPSSAIAMTRRRSSHPYATAMTTLLPARLFCAASDRRVIDLRCLGVWRR